MADIMKRTNFYIGFLLLAILAGCKKQESDDLDSYLSSKYNVEVNEFISMLKSGEYKSAYIPVFTAEDIPDLLSYRNDNQIITSFPINVLSSHFQSECKLGVYALWMVEAVRVAGGEVVTKTFSLPSLNPILCDRSKPELISADLALAHPAASQAYYDWWQSNKDKKFRSFRNIDPLSGTNYKWR
jgi:hypothetical protein